MFNFGKRNQITQTWKIASGLKLQKKCWNKTRRHKLRMPCKPSLCYIWPSCGLYLKVISFHEIGVVTEPSAPHASAEALATRIVTSWNKNHLISPVVCTLWRLCNNFKLYLRKKMFRFGHIIDIRDEPGAPNPTRPDPARSRRSTLKRVIT